VDDLDIFSAALELGTPEDREKYLHDACGENAALRERIQALLQSADKVSRFMEAPAPGIEASPTLDQPPLEQPGTVIGPYKLLQQIGEGGMGVVYLAEQTEPVERRVALKIIKPGMDTRQVIARFEAEQHALALMDHPNIAKVLDAGTTGERAEGREQRAEGREQRAEGREQRAEREAGSPANSSFLPPSSLLPPPSSLRDPGRPYFVMELVKGIPLTEYCDQQRLTPRERLELFIPICQAVQHAHQKGIIHRDIKPSNILVALYDGRPVPKVIDFGVAKAVSQRLTEKTMFTHYGQIVGTLEYMSPEQANLNQLDIDTRSDIYSLGVLLYELLTGATPFDRQRLRSAAFEEMLRIIREEEPPKPSTRLSTIDTLPSVAANRHMEPKKLSTLIRGELDWIVMKALEKDRSRRYETATGLANDIQRYLSDEPVVACPPSRAYRFRKFARRNKAALSAGAVVAAALVLGLAGTSWQSIRATRERDRAIAAEQLATDRLDRAVQAEQVARDEATRADLEAAIAQAVNAFVTEDLLGSADPDAEPDRDLKVRDVLDRAAGTIEGRFADQPLVKAQILRLLGDTYFSLGEYDKARQHLERALQLHQQARGADHAGTLRIARSLAWVDLHEGHYEKSRRDFEDILRRSRDALGPEHPVTLASMAGLASAIYDLGHPAEAEELHSEVLEIRRRVLGPEHPNTLMSMLNLANAINDQGRHAEAEKLYRDVLELLKKVLGPEHPVTLASMNNLALVISRQAHPAEAEELQREVLEIQRRVLPPEHPDTLKSMHNLASAINNQGRHAEAEELHSEVLEIHRRVLGPEHPDTLSSMHNLSVTINAQGRHAEAEELCREVWEIQRRVLGPEHPDTLESMHNLANAIGDQGRHAEAEELNREVLEIRRRVLGPEHPDTLKSMYNLALAIGRQDRLAEAEKLYREVLEIRRRVLGPEHPDTLKSMYNLALAIGRQDRHAEAEKLYREVLEIERRVLGPEHPDTLSSMNNLAIILSELGPFDEAIELHRQLLELWERRVRETPDNAHARESLASAHDAIASVYMQFQKWGEMGRHWQSAMEIREALTRDFPEELASKSNLAWNCRNLATGHCNVQRYDLARPYYERAVQLGRELVAAAPTVKEYQNDLDQNIARLSNAYTNWSWALSTAADVAERDPIKAVEVAQLAMELRPHSANNWNNLGVAQYRAGNWPAAVEALEKADSMIPGGDREHRMFLAMAHWQLGDKDKARELYAQGAAWIAPHRKGSEEQGRFRPRPSSCWRSPRKIGSGWSRHTSRVKSRISPMWRRCGSTVPNGTSNRALTSRRSATSPKPSGWTRRTRVRTGLAPKSAWPSVDTTKPWRT
jgi:eukaryotic-like serine/threonine-protein kinase